MDILLDMLYIIGLGEAIVDLFNGNKGNDKTVKKK